MKTIGQSLFKFSTMNVCLVFCTHHYLFQQNSFRSFPWEIGDNTWSQNRTHLGTDISSKISYLDKGRDSTAGVRPIRSVTTPPTLLLTDRCWSQPLNVTQTRIIGESSFISIWQAPPKKPFLTMYLHFITKYFFISWGL